MIRIGQSADEAQEAETKRAGGFTITREEALALDGELRNYAFGYNVKAQAAYMVVRRMSRWLEETE